MNDLIESIQLMADRGVNPTLVIYELLQIKAITMLEATKIAQHFTKEQNGTNLSGNNSLSSVVGSAP